MKGEEWGNINTAFEGVTKESKKPLLLVSAGVLVITATLFAVGHQIKKIEEAKKQAALQKKVEEAFEEHRQMLRETEKNKKVEEPKQKTHSNDELAAMLENLHRKNREKLTEKKSITQPERAREDGWVYEVDGWQDVRSEKIKIGQVKSLSECIKPNNVIDEDVNKCINGEIKKSW